jgi:hypothetical protein
MNTIEQESGVHFSPADRVNQAFNHVRHLDAMQYHQDAELRQYVVHKERAKRAQQGQQQRHDECMEAAREDRDWYDKMQAVRDDLYEALINEALGACYVFFIMHVVWQ